VKFAWIHEPPFNHFEDGALRGRDIVLARDAFASIGEDFEPVETEFGELLAGLNDGRWDVTTGMFITPDRMARASFTRPIWSLSDGLLVRRQRAGIAGYRSIAQMHSKLAVLRGQIRERTALQNGVRAVHIVVFEHYADAARAVVSGEVAAYASVELAHNEHIARSGNGDLICIPVSDEEKPAELGGFACADIKVRDRLNVALDSLLPSDT